MSKITLQGSSDKIGEALMTYKEQITRALPERRGDLTPERIIQIAATVIAQSADLKACDPATVIGSIMHAAILGLDPTPARAQVYFIPRREQCTMLIGYLGWVTLFWRSQTIEQVIGYAVVEGDEFEYEYGMNPRIITHKPCGQTPDEGGKNITHAYAVAHFKSGRSVIEVLTKQRLDQLRARGGGNGPAWKKDYASMSVAKAIRQLRRHIPSEEQELETAFISDGHVIRPEHYSGGLLNAAAIESPEPLTPEAKAPNFVGTTAEDAEYAVEERAAIEGEQ